MVFQERTPHRTGVPHRRRQGRADKHADVRPGRGQRDGRVRGGAPGPGRLHIHEVVRLRDETRNDFTRAFKWCTLNIPFVFLWSNTNRVLTEC